MRRQLPVEAVIGSVVTTLRANTGVTSLVTSSTGVYNNVEQKAAYPYIEVTSPTDRRVDTFSRFGAEVLVNVKVCSQGRGDQEGARVMSACSAALCGEGGSNTLTLANPHLSLGIAWDNGERYSEIENGITTRYHVGMFRVWTEQTS